ncbi:phosphotransferase [Phycicoccus sp. BSK3Z-2]|uniref:Phosphotransferase n=1 Tax=Phycicoccus avicenniae TaxID=2828860 RepID=A0A941HZM5_9MICO|nr:phosphotransferase [Phycicoccus avicenniae]MBR7742401.1 phosphotransferase [Phycicoccus avicenniae]
MTDDEYAALDTDAQVAVLRDVAGRAVPLFGLDVGSLDLVLHGFNTTFALVTPDGERAAVRVNTNSLARPEHIAAQHAWLHAVTTETDVRVPDPYRTLDGEPFATVREGGGEHRVVVTSWLDGPDVEDCDTEQAVALGRAMAALHEHAEGWTLPRGAALPSFTGPLLGDEDRLSDTSLLDTAGHDVVEEAMRRARAVFEDLPGPRLVIHGDLHGGNLKWHQGRLAVFDVDDAGIGTPALDLAVATFYVRDAPSVEEALRAGYAGRAPLPVVDAAAFETLVASRQLLLANSLLTSSTAELRAMAPEYVHRTVERLRYWLDAGRFLLDPPG